MPSVGPRLKVDGFADYTKRMNDLIQQGKTLDSEMKRVASEVEHGRGSPQ